MRIKVLRAFCIAGARQEPHSEIEVSELFAREVIALGKAEKVGAPAPAASGPMTTDNVPDLVQGKARKGDKHAGE